MGLIRQRHDCWNDPCDAEGRICLDQEGNLLQVGADGDDPYQQP